MNDQVAQNKRRSLVLTVAFGAVIAVVIAVVLALVGLGLVGLAIALVVGAAAAFARYRTSDAAVLRLSGAVEADPARHARLHNLVEGLCIASGLPKPRLYVIDDAAPNAFAIGRSPQHAAIAVTTGLLDKLNRVELEAVLAHELSHVKSGDILVATLAVTMVGFVPLPAPERSRLVQLAVSPGRAARADVSAVEMTRYPPGLIAALEKLRDDPTVVRAGSPAMAHLWIEAPVPSADAEGRAAGGDRDADAHPPIEDRIAALRER